MKSYIVIVIPEGKAKDANADADKQDSGKTGKTFTVGLSPTGQLPITHRWCCWWMDKDTKFKEIKKDFKGKSDKDGDKHTDMVFDLSEGWTPESILEKVKLKTIQPEL